MTLKNKSRSLCVVMLLLALSVKANTQVIQTSYGFCSPNIYGSGNVTIICKGVDPRALEKLNEHLRATQYALDQMIAEAESWALRYRELEASLVQNRIGLSSSDKKLALEALHRGDFEVAIRLLERQRTVERKQQKEFSETAFQLGNAYFANFQLEKALSSYQDAIRLDQAQAKYWRSSAAVRRALYQGKEVANDLTQAIRLDKGTVWDLIFFADAIEFDGNHHVALARAREARSAAVREFGKRSWEYVSALKVLGSVKAGLENHKEAIKTYQEAHQICVDLYGGDDLRCAFLLHSLAITYNEDRNYDAAFKLLPDLFAKYSYFRKNREFSGILHTSGVTNWGLGDYERARYFFAWSLETKRTLYPPKHPQISITLSALGDTLRKLGNFDDAIKYHQEAIDGFIAANGDTHYRVANAYAGMARTFVASGRYEEAIYNFQKTLSIYKQTISEGHPKFQRVSKEMRDAEMLLRKGSHKIEYFDPTTVPATP